jgi:hypothetical protein
MEFVVETREEVRRDFTPKKYKPWNDFKKQKEIKMGSEIAFEKGVNSWIFGTIIDSSLYIFKKEEYPAIFIRAFNKIFVEDEDLIVQEVDELFVVCENSYENILFLYHNPFRSEKQRRWLWSNRPDIAEAWSHGKHVSSKNSHQHRKKQIKDF